MTSSAHSKSYLRRIGEGGAISLALLGVTVLLTRHRPSSTSIRTPPSEDHLSQPSLGDRKRGRDQVQRLTLTSSSVPLQGADCLSPYFSAVSSDDHQLSFQQLTQGVGLIEPATISLRVQVDGKNYLLVSEPNLPVSPSHEGNDSTSYSPFVEKIYELPNPDRALLKETRLAHSLLDVYAIFPQANILLAEKAFRGIGKFQATVILHNGQVDEVGFPPPIRTRCDSVPSDNSPESSTNPLMLKCECN